MVFNATFNNILADFKTTKANNLLHKMVMCENDSTTQHTDLTNHKVIHTNVIT
jgi:hypothetical protein